MTSYTSLSQKTSLLELPIEIRLMIWQLALGNHSVHIATHIQQRTRKWATTLCTSPTSAHEQYTQYLSPNYYAGTERYCKKRLRETCGLYSSTADTYNGHFDCHDTLIDDMMMMDVAVREPKDSISTRANKRIRRRTCPFRRTAWSLLTSSRAVSREVEPIIYGHNTFMFWTAQSLLTFLQARTVAQKRCLSRVEIYPYLYHNPFLDPTTTTITNINNGDNTKQIVFALYERTSWRTLLSPSSIAALTNLRSLHIYLREYRGLAYGLTSDLDRMDIEEAVDVFGGLSVLTGLKSVTVMVGCVDLAERELTGGLGDVEVGAAGVFEIRRGFARLLEGAALGRSE